jgi:GLEYA domain
VANRTVMWVGYFKTNYTGMYTFSINSDDGSYLWLGPSALSGWNTTNALVNNGGIHGAVEKAGNVSLVKDVYYPFRLVYGNYQSKIF